MKELYGIIFLDRTEVILRIYQMDDKEWKLLHYEDKALPSEQSNTEPPVTEIAESIFSLLAPPYARHVVEWKACGRNISGKLFADIAEATGLQMENLSKLREQELLCKGIFTEFW